MNGTVVIDLCVLVGLFLLIYQFSASGKAKRALKHARKTLAGNSTQEQLVAVANDFRLPDDLRIQAINRIDNAQVLAAMLTTYLSKKQDASGIARQILKSTEGGPYVELVATAVGLPSAVRVDAVDHLADKQALGRVLETYVCQNMKEVLLVANKMLDANCGDEYLPLFRRVFHWAQGNCKTSDAMEFAIRLAARYPSIIRENWRIIQTTAHADDSKAHADNGDKAPHIDSTTYYDFFKYPDGHLEPNRNGRKSHHDGGMPASDCTHYDHADTVVHKDVADPNGYLQRFLPAAVPTE